MNVDVQFIQNYLIEIVAPIISASFGYFFITWLVVYALATGIRWISIHI